MGSAGIDGRTGQVLTGWDHTLASIWRIFRTRIGTRVMLRSFGAMSHALIGRRLTAQWVALYRLSIILALECWEPRVSVRKLVVEGTVDQVRDGQVTCKCTLAYMPNGHLGDTTVANTVELELS